MTHFSIVKSIFIFATVCIILLVLLNCKENARIDDEQNSNVYTYYSDGQLKSIIVNNTNHNDTFNLTKDGFLHNTGKLIKIHSTKDSVQVNKQLPIYFEVAMFKRVILHFQTRILDSLQQVIWDTTIEKMSQHSIETFYFKKMLSTAGEYHYKIIGNYIDSTTEKNIYTDSAMTKIIVVGK